VAKKKAFKNRKHYIVIDGQIEKLTQGTFQLNDFFFFFFEIKRFNRVID